MENLFFKMAELQNKAKKFKGNWNSYRYGEYIKPAIQEMLDRNVGKTRDLIKRCVQEYEPGIKKEDRNKVNMIECLDIFLNEFLKKRAIYNTAFPSANQIKERSVNRRFCYKTGSQEEIDSAYGWKRWMGKIESQIKELKTKEKMEPGYLHQLGKQCLNIQINRGNREMTCNFSLEEDDMVRETLRGKIMKWGLKPKSYSWQKFKKKK
jgi:hypothetical protein